MDIITREEHLRNIPEGRTASFEWHTKFWEQFLTNSSLSIARAALVEGRYPGKLECDAYFNEHSCQAFWDRFGTSIWDTIKSSAWKEAVSPEWHKMNQGKILRSKSDMICLVKTAAFVMMRNGGWTLREQVDTKHGWTDMRLDAPRMTFAQYRDDVKVGDALPLWPIVDDELANAFKAMATEKDEDKVVWANKGRAGFTMRVRTNGEGKLIHWISSWDGR